MSPTPLRSVPRPLVVPEHQAKPAPEPGTQLGQFIVADVYQGLEPTVARGRVKFLRVCQEVRADLERLPDGTYLEQYPPFEDYYAAPTHKVRGPHGWPSFVAKGDLGLVPVEEDGSASFLAPAGKVLYFQALDEQLNEIQRMRSLVQLQPGEVRSCIGCHEPRGSTPAVRQSLWATRSPPRPLQPPPWGAGPFAYETIVQPVWDAHCVRCHAAGDEHGIDLAGTLDADRVPASYRTLIAQGWVHHFTYEWAAEHRKAEPLSFGSLHSRLWKVLDNGHYDVQLNPEETRRIKCWIDLNCPLWPDYQYRLQRPATAFREDSLSSATR